MAKTNKYIWIFDYHISLHMKYTNIIIMIITMQGDLLLWVSARHLAARVVRSVLHVHLFQNKYWAFLNQPCPVQCSLIWRRHRYQRIANGVLYSALMSAHKWLKYYRYGVKYWAFGKGALTIALTNLVFGDWVPLWSFLCCTHIIC